MAKQGEREENHQNWRKEVDDNIKRLQSLQFGADIALENGDYTSAQLISLRLLGFLESRSQNDVDSSFIHPIRCEALSKLASARRELAPVSDRQAFEAAGITPGKIFSMNTDIGKIKQSKYFRCLIQQSSKGNTSAPGDLDDRHGNMTRKTPKTISEADLSSWHGNNTMAGSNVGERGRLTSKTNGDDCIILEKACTANNHPRGFSLNGLAEEERTLGNNLGVKRHHMETRSPRSDCIQPPSGNKETNGDFSANAFVTARTKLELDVKQRRGLGGSPSSSVSPLSDYNSGSRSYGHGGKSYGVSRRGVRGNFIPPIRSNGNNSGNLTARSGGKCDDAEADSTRKCMEMLCGPDGEIPEKLKNLEPRLIEHVSNEIMDQDPNVRWDDIAGLEHAKKCVTEMVVWPLLRPDIFKGCRAPGRGLLLFGPPIGEGEKLVRALFGVASCRQPAVIFVDEIDSLLSQRKSDGEHEASRRLKTQFLIEMEGFDNGSEQILLIGATNRPQELDEAARRRLTKRLYIPLPSGDARACIIRNLLEKDGLFRLLKEDMDILCKLTEGYSGSDMKNLVKDASMGPLRDALRQGIEITKLNKEDMRPVTLQDFKDALQEVRPSVSPNELGIYENWNKQFGSLAL